MSAIEFSAIESNVIHAGNAALAQALEGKLYDATKSNEWVSTITSQVCAELEKLGKQFKFMVTCIIREQRGGALTSQCFAYWDAQTDGVCSMNWDNKSLYARLTVFATVI